MPVSHPTVQTAQAGHCSVISVRPLAGSPEANLRGRVSKHLGNRMKHARLHGGAFSLAFTQQDGSDTELQFEHVIAATGYSVSLQRLHFMHSALREQTAKVEDVPTLNRNLESSVLGLYFVSVFLAQLRSLVPLRVRIQIHLQACVLAPRDYPLGRRRRGRDLEHDGN